MNEWIINSQYFIHTEKYRIEIVMKKKEVINIIKTSQIKSTHQQEWPAPHGVTAALDMLVIFHTAACWDSVLDSEHLF